MIWIDSILLPRHVRWTVVFANIYLIWFTIALYYLNIGNVIIFPEIEKSIGPLSLKDILISIVAPFINMIVMYLVVSIFRITDSRIKYSTDLNTMS